MSELRAIWKFPIPAQRAGVILMPAGAEVLSTAVQAATINDPEQVVVWALVRPASPKVEHGFLALETGEEIEAIFIGQAKKFVGTVTLRGQYVLHVFDFGENPA